MTPSDHEHLCTQTHCAFPNEPYCRPSGGGNEGAISTWTKYTESDELTRARVEIVNLRIELRNTRLIGWILMVICLVFAAIAWSLAI